jgi:hypothetical protein
VLSSVSGLPASVQALAWGSGGVQSVVVDASPSGARPAAAGHQGVQAFHAHSSSGAGKRRPTTAGLGPSASSHTGKGVLVLYGLIALLAVALCAEVLREIRGPGPGSGGLSAGLGARHWWRSRSWLRRRR